MLYPENHEQCWRSVEERRPVERSYLLEIVALHTIPTCQGSCLTSQSAPQRKMGLSLYHASGHTTLNFPLYRPHLDWRGRGLIRCCAVRGVASSPACAHPCTSYYKNLESFPFIW